MADAGETTAPVTPATKPPEGIADHDEAEVRSLAPSVCLTPCGPTMVPVPYNIWDKHGHDKNYTPTVRWRGNAAMVLRSITEHVHGDEAGTGGGVISGIRGGICEPIDHEPTVRSEGSPVIRDGDLCWMSNKNTIGVCVLKKNQEVNQLPQPQPKPKLGEKEKTPQQELLDRVKQREADMADLEKSAQAVPKGSAGEDALYKQYQQLQAQNDIDRFSNFHGSMDGKGVVQPLDPVEFLNDYQDGLGDQLAGDPVRMADTLKGLNVEAANYARDKMFEGQVEAGNMSPKLAEAMSTLAAAAMGGLGRRKGVRVTGPHWHHKYPKEFKPFFKKRGINIDDKENGRMVPQPDHTGKGGIHSSGYNQEWGSWIKENPNASRLQVENFGRQMEIKYGADKFPAATRNY